MNALPSAVEQLKQRLSWDELDHLKLEKHLLFCLEEEVGPTLSSNPIDGDLTTKACEIEPPQFFLCKRKMVVELVLSQ